MPVFLQALPLSLQTFWRYLILLPVLAVVGFFAYLLAFVPILGMVVPSAISAAFVMIGMRCALAARGHDNPLDAGSLITASLIFGLITFVIDLAVPYVEWAILTGLQAVGVEIDPIGLLTGLLGASAYWSGVLLALLSPTALVSAALAVPMASAAYSATSKGGGTGVFYGFGSGMIGLLIVMLVWLFGGHMFSVVGEIGTVFFYIASLLMDLYRGEPLDWQLEISPRSGLAGTLVMAWASSWFFATAVLTWERKQQAEHADRARETEANRVSSQDLRALRQRRMQGG